MTQQLLALALEPATVTLTPGQTTTIELSIRNTTGRVGDFRVELVNPRRLPIQAQSKQVNLKVGDTATLTVALSMAPDARPLAGVHLAGIQVTSTSVALVGATEELRVSVPSLGDATMRVEPEISRNGRFVIRIASQASAPLQLALSGRDSEGSARFTIRPPTLVVPPYEQAVAQARVRAARPFTGEDTRRQLTFEAAGGRAPLVATATLVRERLIARPLLIALIVLFLLLVLAVLAAVALSQIDVGDLVDKIRDLTGGGDSTQTETSPGGGGPTGGP